MTERNMFRWEADDTGIVVLTMDDPNQSANIMNDAFSSALAATVDRLEQEKGDITGVIITSAKKTFFAGGDLGLLRSARAADAARIATLIDGIKASFRRLETLGRPVVAAINGAALGGGYELALACHYRIALNAQGSLLGLPEVTLGLLPGAGGITRTVRMFGIQQALTGILLRGQRRTTREALDCGLVHEVVDTPEEMFTRARQWITSHVDAAQPWDMSGYKIPGGTPANPAFAAGLPAFPANLRKQLGGAPMPAPHHILAAAVEGAQVDFDTALKIETSYFVELVCGQISTNMINAFFFDMHQVNSGVRRPEGYPRHQARKAVILGAGMMGVGIAYVCARAGLNVILKDVSLELAEKGKEYSRVLLDKAVTRGKLTQSAASEVLARILATDQVAAATDADLVIEAVFEDPELKKKVFAELEQVLSPGAVLASNTSTLPISELANGIREQANFIGLHFFSPVDKIPLLEIVVGEKTSDTTLAKVFDIARQLGKTPIIVNDSRGFFTSRVIAAFLYEAIAMIGEGVSPVSVEQAGKQAGYATPPLQLIDELTLTLLRKISQETRAGVESAGGVWKSHPADTVLDRMVEEFNRKGRFTGAGFYDYVEGKRVSLWPGLTAVFGKADRDLSFVDLQERMLFIEALEAVKCLDEGVLRSVADANIGSLLGIGFPPWTGGVLQYINQYQGGPGGFVTRARELSERYGERFTPPASLVARAEHGENYQ